MNTMIKVIIIFAMAISQMGCGTQDNEFNQTLAAVTTVSALVATIPMVPIDEAYHIINNTEGKVRKRNRLLAERFDPIYREKVKMIENRSPDNDAKSFIDDGVVVFLSSVPGNAIYPGLTRPEHVLVHQIRNGQLIRNNELASYLSDLLAQDRAHQTIGLGYFGAPFQEFNRISWAYKEEFNRYMVNELKSKKTLQ